MSIFIIIEDKAELDHPETFLIRAGTTEEHCKTSVVLNFKRASNTATDLECICELKGKIFIMLDCGQKDNFGPSLTRSTKPIFTSYEFTLPPKLPVFPERLDNKERTVKTFIERMFVDSKIIRDSYDVHSEECAPIVDVLLKTWPTFDLHSSKALQILGLTEVHHRVGEPSLQYYNWEAISQDLASSYLIEDVASFDVKPWYGFRLCLSSKKALLKLPFNKPIPHPSTSIRLDGLFFAITYEEGIGEVGDTRDMYFKVAPHLVTPLCAELKLPIPLDPIDDAKVYGVVFDTLTLKPLKIKAYFHTRF